MSYFIKLLKEILCCDSCEEEEHVGNRYEASRTDHFYSRIPTTSTLPRDPSPSYLRRQFEEDAKIKIVIDHVNNRTPTTSTLSRDPSPSYLRRQFEEDAKIKIVIDHVNNRTPVKFNASAVKGSSSVNNTSPLKLPGVTPKPILLPPVSIPSIVQHKNSVGFTNKSLAPVKFNASAVKGSSSVNNTSPLKLPGVTPKPVLLPPVSIHSIVQHKNSGGITNKSLAPFDPWLPSSSAIRPPPSPSHLSNTPKEIEYVRAKKGTTTYEVPEAFNTLFEKNIIPEVLKKPLSSLTYRDYFAALLYAEDYYMEKWSEYLLEEVTLELHKAAIYEKVNKNKRPIANDKREEKYFVVFEIDKVRERRPFLLSRDFVLVRPAGNKNAKPFKGNVFRVVQRNLVLAEFGVDFLSRHSPKLKYDVSFSFNRVCLKRSHQAVEAAMDPSFQVFLFPNQASRIRDLNPPYLITPHRNVNHVQASAIYHISRIKNSPPYLIEGPLCLTPEKKLSRTGLVIQQAVLRICEVSPGCRILINAPTNNTCDVLMRRLMEEIPESDIFRANAAFREIDGVPCDILPLCTVQEGCFTCPSLQQLKNFKVILSTYVSSFRLHNEGISGGHFSHIFLVDASSVTEPEIMISLANLADPKTVVVVSGAFTNCPTRIRTAIARENGLAFSYFKRLFGSEPYCSRNPTFVTCIDTIG